MNGNIAGKVVVITGKGGQAFAFAISQPDDVDINEILFRPTRQVL